jgi:hypothetical protein
MQAIHAGRSLSRILSNTCSKPAWPTVAQVSAARVCPFGQRRRAGNSHAMTAARKECGAARPSRQLRRAVEPLVGDEPPHAATPSAAATIRSPMTAPEPTRLITFTASPCDTGLLDGAHIVAPAPRFRRQDRLAGWSAARSLAPSRDRFAAAVDTRRRRRSTAAPRQMGPGYPSGPSAGLLVPVSRGITVGRAQGTRFRLGDGRSGVSHPRVQRTRSGRPSCPTGPDRGVALGEGAPRERCLARGVGCEAVARAGAGHKVRPWAPGDVAGQPVSDVSAGARHRRGGMSMLGLRRLWLRFSACSTLPWPT